MNSRHILERKQKAMRMYASGGLKQARQLCEEICSQGVSDHDVYCLLGIISGKTGQFNDAVNYCLQSIKLCPEHVDAYFNLGLALMNLGRRTEAARALEFVIARRSYDINAFYMLGLLRTINGDYPGAISCFQSARRINPGFLDAVAGEVQVYERQGEIDRACKLIEPFTRSHPAHAKIALVYGRLLLRKGDFGVAIDYLKKLVGDAATVPGEKSGFHFLLGDLYDRSGDYDTAFDHYQMGNRLKGVRFDEEQFRLQIEDMISRFDFHKIGRFSRSSCPSDLPLFIIGSPRSGTSLVEQILASHTDVHGAGELPDITRIVEEFLWLAGHGDSITTALLDERAGHYLAGLRLLSPAAARVTDKMPGNYYNLGYMDMLFPGARVVHVSRNPLDTCLSCYFQDFAAVHTYAYDLENLGIFYEGYRKLMNHWNQVLERHIHEVVYENLVENPEREIRRLLEFCGLEWDDACLRYHENKRMIRTASYDQANRPIYKDSVGRWRNYEKFIEPLTRRLMPQ